jgi:hypothetical protein
MTPGAAKWRQTRHLLLRLRIPLQGVRQVLELAVPLVQLPLRPRPAPLQECNRTEGHSCGRICDVWCSPQTGSRIVLRKC